jgi:hypothetical protein
MVGDDSSLRRSTLRRAERARDDANERERLGEDGVEIGEAETMSGPEFLASLDEDSDDDLVPSVTVVVSLDDTQVTDRDDLIDPLCARLERVGAGEWNGSGQGSIGGESFIDVQFIVDDINTAVSILQDEMKRLSVGPKARIYCSDDTVYSLDGIVQETE